MSTFELNLRIDNSIPYHKIPTFPRYRKWDEAERIAASDAEITVKLVTPDEILALSSRWDANYTYGITTETDEAGEAVFTDLPHGSVDADPGLLTCTLQKGDNYIRVERTGGILRDYKAGEVVMGTAIWSKARVSAFLIVTVE